MVKTSRLKRHLRSTRVVKVAQVAVSLLDVAVMNVALAALLHVNAASASCPQQERRVRSVAIEFGPVWESS